MSESKNSVVKTNDKDGKELLTLVDSDGSKTGFSATMESVWEERETDTIDALAILAPQEVEELKAPQVKTNRLELPPQYLINKISNEVWLITMGSVPPIEERIAKDITGSFLSAQKENDSDALLSIIVPYKKDGTIPSDFPFNITGEKTNG